MMRLKSALAGPDAPALASWGLVLALALAAAADALTGQLLWVVFSLSIATVAVFPAVVTGEWTTVSPWQALLLATLPVGARAVGLFHAPMAYVSVATLALLIAVQLTNFSATRMPSWFAVSFVVMTTMAVAACWGIVQYHSDSVLGTTYLSDRTALMWDLVGATVTGLAAGLVFEAYFRRRAAGYRGSAGREI